MTTVYLLDKNNEPLMPCHNGAMPCHNGAFIRNILKEKKAKVVRAKPFTVQLMVEVRNMYKQPVTLGVDAGYKHIGFSVTTPKKELFSAELEQDCGMVERNKERRMYRRQRRNRKRYRKPRFNNRRVPTDWIAPSLERKRNTAFTVYPVSMQYPSDYNDTCRDRTVRPRVTKSDSRRSNTGRYGLSTWGTGRL